MNSFNHVLISGNITRDPEMRSTASGLVVLGIGVAVTDRKKNQQTGNWDEYTNFIDCSMFGARAQSVSSYLAKGMRVTIEGKLRWSKWESNGQKRSKIEVIVDEIEWSVAQQSNNSPKPVQAPVQQAYAQQATYSGRPVPVAQAVGAVSSVYDEDIPF